MSKIVHLCSLCCCIETVHEHDEEAKYLNEGNVRIFFTLGFTYSELTFYIHRLQWTCMKMS